MSDGACWGTDSNDLRDSLLLRRCVASELVNELNSDIDSQALPSFHPPNPVAAINARDVAAIVSLLTTSGFLIVAMIPATAIAKSAPNAGIALDKSFLTLLLKKEILAEAVSGEKDTSLPTNSSIDGGTEIETSDSIALVAMVRIYYIVL